MLKLQRQWIFNEYIIGNIVVILRRKGLRVRENGKIRAPRSVLLRVNNGVRSDELLKTSVTRQENKFCSTITNKNVIANNASIPGIEFRGNGSVATLIKYGAWAMQLA